MTTNPNDGLTGVEDLLSRQMNEGFQGVHRRFDGLEEKLETTSRRVGKLENWRSYLTGAWAVTAGGVIVGGRLLIDWAKTKIGSGH